MEALPFTTILQLAKKRNGSRVTFRPNSDGEGYIYVSISKMDKTFYSVTLDLWGIELDLNQAAKDKLEKEYQAYVNKVIKEWVETHKNSKKEFYLPYSIGTTWLNAWVHKEDVQEWLKKFYDVVSNPENLTPVLSPFKKQNN